MRPSRYPHSLRAGGQEQDALLVHYKQMRVRAHWLSKTVTEDMTKNPHFIYGHDKVVVNLLGHGRVKLVRRMGPNKVSDPGRRSLQRPIRPTPDEIQIARNFVLLQFTQVKRVDVGLD
jgi:hypothetical protein